MYIGTSTVVKDEVLEDGSHKVELSDGSFEYLSNAQLEIVQSLVAYPDTEITMRKWKPTLAGILNILLEANMQMTDKDWLMSRIDESLTANFKAAVAKKFGVSGYENVSLQQIDSVLKSE